MITPRTRSALAPRSGERVARAQRGPGEGQTRAAIAVVIAGLDTASRVNPTCGALYCATRASPSCGAIHPVRKKLLTKKMDPRVKPAGDGTFGYARLPLSGLATLSPQRRGEGADRVRRSS